MKNILLIGVGGTGNMVVDMLYRKMNELGNQTDNRIMALVFNMDTNTVHTMDGIQTIQMVDENTVGNICNRIGAKQIEDWFPVPKEESKDADTQYMDIRNQQMSFGMSLWRKKAYLAFLNLMYKKESRLAFHNALEQMANSEPGSTYEIYVISSIAGATGSGAFLPITLYAKRYIRRVLGITPNISAMITCPDIYVDYLVAENVSHAYANAYAVQRELNAINAVARGGCNQASRKKNAPVTFRIGSESEPMVGVLFDSTDPAYWKPEAAPFDKIYVLDRIPGIQSIEEHHVVLADSLYTLICTNVGASVDAETSNHATLISQNNGGSAIFASISTSRIKFPAETILDYLAKERTLRTCKDQWLLLHNAVSDKIQEKKQRAIEKRAPFVLTEEQYAQMTLEALEELEESDNGIAELIHRWTDLPNQNAEETARPSKTRNSADDYFTDLKSMIADRAPKAATAEHQIQGYERRASEDDQSQSYSFLHRLKGVDPKSVLLAAEELQEKLIGYYRECVLTVNNRARGISDAILTFDAHKDPSGHRELSLLQRLLIKDGRYMHPVAAMVQLCRLRKKVGEYLSAADDAHLIPFEQKESIPQEFYRMPEDDEVQASWAKRKKSRYYTIGKALENQEKDYNRQHPEDRKEQPGSWRMLNFFSQKEEYLKARSDEDLDVAFLKEDAVATLHRIAFTAKNELNNLIFKRVCVRLDELIRQYRRFFERFVEAEENARLDAEAAKRRDAGKVGSILNVYSKETQKETILREILGTVDVDRLEDILRSDDMAGRNVWEIALNAIRKEKDDSGHFSDDRNMIRLLLDNMNADNRTVIARNPEYRRLSGISILEAIEEGCKDPTLNAAETQRYIKNTVKTIFSTALEVASPTLCLEDGDCDEKNVIVPSEVCRVLMPIELAMHIKKRASFYEIDVPNEQEGIYVLQACAEEFAHKYILSTVRVNVVSTIPPNVMYISGEKMDITPTRISKFNEMGRVPGYYSHYRQLISRCREYQLDFWNPHLGFGWHKRASLPYINPKMEQDFDERVSRALLYGFLCKKIRFCNQQECFVDAQTTPIRYNGEEIGRTNPFHLFSHLREDEELVEEWSEALHQKAQEWRKDLPVIRADSDLPIFLEQVTKIPLLKALRKDLYGTLDKTPKKASKRGEIPAEEALVAPKNAQEADADQTEEAKKKKESGPGLLEFAYGVKCSEETAQDCNDAEKLMAAAFHTLQEICMPQELMRNHPDTGLATYHDQLRKLLEQFAKRCDELYKVEEKEEKYKSAQEKLRAEKEPAEKEIQKVADLQKKLQEAQNESELYFKRVVAWANRIDTFCPAELVSDHQSDSVSYRAFRNPSAWKTELK